MAAAGGGPRYRMVPQGLNACQRRSRELWIAGGAPRSGAPGRFEGTQTAVTDALIDRAHLDAQTFGDTDLAAELLGLFSDQCASLMPALRDADRPGPERADLAHTLKGSALGVGATRFAALASALEARLRTGGEAAPETIARLTEAVDATLAEIGAPSPRR